MQIINYRKKLELRRIKKWEKINGKWIVPKQVNVKEISTQQTLKNINISCRQLTETAANDIERD